jgi:hypothetical protein
VLRKFVIGLVVLGLVGCGGGDDGNGGDSGGSGGPERVKNPTQGPDQIKGTPGDDEVAETEDDAIDEIDCGEGEDKVLKPDARDRLTNCETVGWTAKPLGEAPYENVITVVPIVSPGGAQFTATCPQADCQGELELRTPEERKPLGRGAFNLAKGVEGQIVVTLTKRGSELAKSEGFVRVVIRSGGGINSGFSTFFKETAPGA